MNISVPYLARRAFFALIPTFITYNVLLFYGFLGNSVFYALLALSFAAYFFMDRKNAFLLACSLLGTTLLLNLLLGLLGFEDRMYYRPHERLTVYNPEMEIKGYKKNADITVRMPFGDTLAVGTEKHIEPEPRRVRFRTDSLGFRNSGNYKGQKYVLAGDSFVVGDGSTQEDTLVSQLKERYGIDAYCLAYPGGIPEYVKYILYLGRKRGAGFKVSLFLYEGNDFSEGFSRGQFVMRKPFLEGLFDRYFALYKETVLYRYTYSLFNKVTGRPLPSRRIVVNGHAMGEFEEYIRVSRREAYRFPEKVVAMLSLVKDRIDHIYFIPTKFRVYHSFIEGADREALPHAQWEAVKALSERFNVPCTDLTGPLTAKSAEILKQGRYTYWKDDSHWNRYGIAVAAKVVSDQIKAEAQREMRYFDSALEARNAAGSRTRRVVRTCPGRSL